jgi:hypothetical protein
VRYIDDGETAIDNNTTERAIEPIVIGRRNWQFANTPAGATASANLFGLLDTAKANAIEPDQYLANLFTELPQRDIEAGDPVDDLWLWNVDLPDSATANCPSSLRSISQHASVATLTAMPRSPALCRGDPEEWRACDSH